MKYQIKIEKDAQKFLKKLPRPDETRVLKAIAKLPDEGDRKQMKGHPGFFRLRVGDYRIIYTVDNGRLIVRVVDAGNRGQIYNRYPSTRNFSTVCQVLLRRRRSNRRYCAAHTARRSLDHSASERLRRPARTGRWPSTLWTYRAAIQQQNHCHRQRCTAWPIHSPEEPPPGHAGKAYSGMPLRPLPAPLQVQHPRGLSSRRWTAGYRLRAR